MGKIKDITGQRFGALVAVKRTDEKNYYGYFWLFNCDCGKQIKAQGSSVPKSCGCLTGSLISKSRFKDLSGKIFGQLKVIKKIGRDKNNNALWECLCVCGKSRNFTTATLNGGDRTSCGCGANYKGENHYGWKGGRRTDKSGYVYVKVQNHPFSTAKNEILEHRLVMEKHIGRYLLPTEEVHHKNTIRDDNRIENLELWSKSHPAGARAEDLVSFAREILETYGSLFPEKEKTKAAN